MSKIGSSAWGAAKHYAGMFSGFVAKGPGSSLAGRAAKSVDDAAGLSRAAKNLMADGPLDWSKADKHFGSRWSHIDAHGVDDLTKKTHGVFDAGLDPHMVVEQAWARARRSNLSGQQSGAYVAYVVDMGEQIGRSGGTTGTGAGLNRVRIVIDRSQGSNHIVTAYPY